MCACSRWADGRVNAKAHEKQYLAPSERSLQFLRIRLQSLDDHARQNVFDIEHGMLAFAFEDRPTDAIENSTR